MNELLNKFYFRKKLVKIYKLKNQKNNRFLMYNQNFLLILFR
jgi:hypothetical protein